MDHERERPDAEVERDAVESVLSSLVPTRTRIDRDRILYAAGEQAGRSLAEERARERSRSLRIWQGLTLALAVATGSLGWRLANVPTEPGRPLSPDVAADEAPTPPLVRDESPDPAPVIEDDPEEVVVAISDPRPVERPRRPFAGSSNFLAMRHVALTRGVDALPSETLTGGVPSTGNATYGHLRRTLVDSL